MLADTCSPLLTAAHCWPQLTLVVIKNVFDFLLRASARLLQNAFFQHARCTRCSRELTPDLNSLQRLRAPTGQVLEGLEVFSQSLHTTGPKR